MNQDENTPLEWRETPYFDASVFWMARVPLDLGALRANLRDGGGLEQERAALRDALEDPELDAGDRAELEGALEDLELEESEQDDALDSLPPPQEIIPGWFFQVRVTFGQFLPTPEAARQHIRDRIRGWNLRPFGLFEDTPKDAPVWLSKSERRKLLAEFDAAPLLEQPEGEERYLLRFYKPLSNSAALGIEIMDVAHHSEFVTVTGAPNDPLRTLVGKHGTLSMVENPDENTHSGDWKTLSEGIIALEGSTLRVGTLQLEVQPGDEINGIAFDSAYWTETSSGKEFDLTVDPRESGNEPRTSAGLERDEAEDPDSA